MIRLEGFTLRDVVHFEQAHVPVSECPPFVCVTGWNRDSLVSEEQNNAAGKSVLFGSIGNAVYDAAPLARTKTARKDMVNGKGSAIEFMFTDNDGQQLNVVQHPSKYVIEYIDDEGNAEDQRVRGKAAQQAFLYKHWPISVSEFYSYVYLQGQKELEFQRGSPSARLSFLTNVFRLDSYDALRKAFAKKLDASKVYKNKHEVLARKLHDIDHRLHELGELDTKALEQLRKEAKDYQKEVERAGITLRDADRLVSGIDYLNKLLVSLEKNKPEHDKDWVKQQAASLKAWSRYSDKLDDYKSSTKSLEKKLAKLPKAKDMDFKSELKSLRSDLDKAVDKLGSAKRKLSVQNEVTQDLKELDDALAKLDLGSPKKVRKLLAKNENMDDEIGVAKATLHLRTLLDTAEGATCPTCQQSVDLKSVKKAVKRAEETLTVLNALRKARSILAKRDELEKQYDGTDYAPVVEKLRDKRASLQKAIDDLEEQRQAQKERKSIQATLDSIKAPKKPDVPEPEVKEKELAKIERGLSKYKETQRDLKTLYISYPEFESDAPDVSALRKEHKKAKKTYKAAQKSLGKVQKNITRLEAMATELKLLCKQKKEIETEISEMEDVIQNHDLFKDLVEIYGKKGLKLRAADQILRILEDNLNQYAPRIFFEPIRFELHTKDDGVHAFAINGDSPPRDIRLLSGSETCCFRLLFMMCMLIMAPDNLRTNFVVLDEPDANMDDPARDRFINDFLPELQMLVDHIFLITPKSASNYPDAEHWIVKKENGVSELINARSVTEAS